MEIACVNCGEQCIKIYQVKIIDRVGNMTFEKVCGEECAEDIQERYYQIHKNRASEIKNQSFQRLK